jgi:ribosome-associated protein
MPERLYSQGMTNGESSGDETITVRDEPIELCQLLKFAGLTSTGGEAKMVIGDGLVAVNGEVDTRKRRKLVAGDRVSFDGRSLIVAVDK